jgi:hypothetical protein
MYNFYTTDRCDYNVPSFVENGRDLREEKPKYTYVSREVGNFRLTL